VAKKKMKRATSTSAETSQPSKLASVDDESFSDAMRAKRGEEPLLTADRFARTIADKDLAGAWLHCEGLRPRVRRLSQAQWQKEYDAWLTAPRG